MGNIKGLSVLLNGNFLVQLIAFMFMPVVTRLYSPDDIGLYQYLTTIALVISPFVGFSLDQAIVKKRSALELDHLFVSACFLAFISSIFFGFLFFLYIVVADVDVGYLVVPLFQSLIFLGAIYSYFQSYFMNKGEYLKYSSSGIIFSLFSNFIKVLAGFFAASSYLLLISILFGYVIALIYSVTVYGFPRFALVKLKGLVKVLSDNREFSVYFSLSQFVAILVNWHLIFISPLLANASEVGLLALAIMITKTPSHPFLSAIANFTYSEGVRSGKIGLNYMRLLFKLGVSSGFLMAIVLLLTYFYGEDIISNVFGMEWGGSSTYAFLLAIPIMTSFIFYPFIFSISNILSKQKIMFYVDSFFGLIFSVLVGCSLLFSLSLFDFVLYNSLIMSALYVVKFIVLLIGMLWHVKIEG